MGSFSYVCSLTNIEINVSDKVLWIASKEVKPIKLRHEIFSFQRLKKHFPYGYYTSNGLVFKYGFNEFHNSESLSIKFGIAEYADYGMVDDKNAPKENLAMIHLSAIRQITPKSGLGMLNEILIFMQETRKILIQFPTGNQFFQETDFMFFITLSEISKKIIEEKYSKFLKEKES